MTDKGECSAAQRRARCFKTGLLLSISCLKRASGSGSRDGHMRRMRGQALAAQLAFRPKAKADADDARILPSAFMHLFARSWGRCSRPPSSLFSLIDSCAVYILRAPSRSPD